MDYEDILAPVAMYRDRLKAEHSKNTADAFEDLVKRSGVDEQANAALVQKIRKLEKIVASLDTKLSWWKFLRVLAILIAVIGAALLILCFTPFGGPDGLGITPAIGISGGAASVLALVLIFTLLNRKVKAFSDLVAANCSSAWSTRGT